MFRVLSETEHEAKCRRCGMSCHTPILLGNEPVIVPEIHCLFLRKKPDSNHFYCSVYERRFELAPWCKTSAEAIPLNALAWDCPYAFGIPHFKGKRWARDYERPVIMRALREAFLKDGLPYADNPDSALAVLNTNGERWSFRLEGQRYRFFRVDENAATGTTADAADASSPHSANIDSAPDPDPSSP